MTDVFVFGASGHAKVVIDVLRSRGEFRPAAVFDDDREKAGAAVLGVTVAGDRVVLESRRGELRHGIVAIGSNEARLQIADWLARKGFGFVVAAHSHAVIAGDARLGEGTVLMAGVVVNSDADIGRHVIVNTGASVDHDCVVEDGVHLAPGVRLCGGCRVGKGALVGVGAVLVPGVQVGAGAVVGAGSVIIEDLPAGARVAGNPARRLQGTND
jgi:sugar O-acyltransferase (sialic acid O-acetyltransferase NeuD family)